MTPRKTDLRERKDTILAITINHYIQTVSPVSSSFIAERSSLDLSPATIRNILAELEQDGYLTHPHTSAGRVPTQRGYRYFVDHLMNEINLLEEEKGRIKAEYEKKTLELEGLLEKTSEVLSDLTHYTSIISIDGWDRKLIYKGTNFIVDYPQYHNIKNDIQRISNILAVLDEKEKLLQILNQDLQNRVDILIGQELECSDIEECSLVISTYKTKKGPSGRIAVLGPTRMDYPRVISTLDYCSEIIEELL